MIVTPVLDMEAHPHTHGLQEELEKVQNRAARFATGNDGSMTDILGQLKWESFKKKKNDSRFILLYKGLKGKDRSRSGSSREIVIENYHAVVSQLHVFTDSMQMQQFCRGSVR